MRWWPVALVVVLLATACHHAPERVPEGAVRERWLAARGAPVHDLPDDGAGACPASADEVVAGAVLHAQEAIARRAESKALRAAADVPDARPLGLRLTNFRVDGGFTDRAEAALRFRPERPGTIAAERDAITREADQALAEARDEERVVRFEVRVLLARARAAALRTELATRDVDAARAEVDIARAAVARKAGNDLDLASAELALSDALSEQARRAAEHDQLRSEALALGGFAARCPLVLGDDDAPPPVEDLAALEATALAEHPLVDLRWAAEQRASAEGHALRAAAWPWLDFVQVGLERRADPQGDETHVVVGLELALPIFLWGGEAGDAAEAEILAQRQTTRATIAAITHEVRAAHAAVVAARGRLDAQPAGLEPTRLDALRAAVRGGYGDARDLAELEREHRRLERRRIDALEAAWEAAIRLDAALGR